MGMSYNKLIVYRLLSVLCFGSCASPQAGHKILQKRIVR